jgi:coenzyme Q-binding protein COQ10
LRHQVTRTLPYTPEQLFNLVGDVEKYPDFVPWISSLRTWNPQQLGEGVDTVDAEASVGFAFLTERFSTRVTRDAVKREIAVDLLSGPFRRLENRWRFSPDPAGTRVEFEIDFLFKSRLLEALLAANFHHAVGRLMACFDARAKALYG